MAEVKIALTGKMRAGKDTVFKLLEQELHKFAEANRYKPEIFQIAFGDALKEYAHALFPERFVEGKKDRNLYQNFGQKLREIDPDVWVKKVERSVNQLRPPENMHISYYVSDGMTDADIERAHGKHPSKLPRKFLFAPIITDLRQPNEYKYAKENGFYIIKIDAPDEIRLARIEASGDDFKMEDFNHETEQHIDTYETHFTINNMDNGLDNLKEDVSKIVKEILQAERIGDAIKG